MIGLNYLGCLFLGLMYEEDAFWTLCATIEDIRPADYFSPSPRTLGLCEHQDEIVCTTSFSNGCGQLGGYHLDVHILDGVVREVFPELKNSSSAQYVTVRTVWMRSQVKAMTVANAGDHHWLGPSRGSARSHLHWHFFIRGFPRTFPID